MRVSFSDATAADAEAISALHAQAAEELTARFGTGHWSRAEIVRRVAPPSAHLRLRVGRVRGRLVCALRLQTKKPWAIDVSYFTPVQRPLYLSAMVVAIADQGRGVGRAAIADAIAIARAWPADAIRLDAYAADAGAGPFYAKCGFAKLGRVVYKGNPLVYYELMLSEAWASRRRVNRTRTLVTMRAGSAPKRQSRRSTPVIAINTRECFASCGVRE